MQFAERPVSFARGDVAESRCLAMVLLACCLLPSGETVRGVLIVARVVEAETSPVVIVRAAMALTDLLARGAL